ncbi:MAG TPA: hypothetical protein VJR23_04500 [Candidatus Acidoferrales bacterium]|nr:hypothetical protein [Candidatus Acidoferrales bacterium]
MSAATATSPAAPPSEFQVPPIAQPPVEPTLSERIRSHGFCTLLANDNSLFPWIRRGDLVFIRRSEFNGIMAGEFILCEQGSRVVLRRVLRHKMAAESGNHVSGLLVKGHKGRTKFEHVTAGHYLGRAIRIHRRSKHIDMQSFERAALSKVLTGFSRLGISCRQSLHVLRAILFT